MKKIAVTVFLIFSLFFQISIVKAVGLGDVNSKFKNFGSGVGADTYSTPESLVGVLISVALTSVGLIFFVLMIYAGYLWFTARGEDEPVQKAQRIIKSTIIGFVLIASAYAITTFVGKRLENSSSGTIQSTKCTALGPDWQCGDIDYCLKFTKDYNADDAIDEKIDLCDQNPEICQTGMCKGEETNICCSNAPQKETDSFGYTCVAKCVPSGQEGVLIADTPAMWMSNVGQDALRESCDCRLENPVLGVEPRNQGECQSLLADSFDCNISL